MDGSTCLAADPPPCRPSEKILAVAVKVSDGVYLVSSDAQWADSDDILLASGWDGALCVWPVYNLRMC
jgi:hypothetical protein